MIKKSLLALLALPIAALALAICPGQAEAGAVQGSQGPVAWLDAADQALLAGLGQMGPIQAVADRRDSDRYDDRGDRRDGQDRRDRGDYKKSSKKNSWAKNPPKRNERRDNDRYDNRGDSRRSDRGDNRRGVAKRSDSRRGDRGDRNDRNDRNDRDDRDDRRDRR
jgi:hypothetical protein